LREGWGASPAGRPALLGGKFREVRITAEPRTSAAVTPQRGAHFRGVPPSLPPVRDHAGIPVLAQTSTLRPWLFGNHPRTRPVTGHSLQNGRVPDQIVISPITTNGRHTIRCQPRPGCRRDPSTTPGCPARPLIMIRFTTPFHTLSLAWGGCPPRCARARADPCRKIGRMVHAIESWAAKPGRKTPPPNSAIAISSGRKRALWPS